MNKKVLTLILVIVTATSTNTMAQNIKKWSLRQCIDYAMDNNIQLQKSKISENVAETELKTSQSRPSAKSIRQHDSKPKL